MSTFSPEAVDAFLASIPELEALSQGEKVKRFIYFITIVLRQQAAKPEDIRVLFRQSRLKEYSRLLVFLSEESKGRKPSLIRVQTGYTLERSEEQRILETFVAESEHAVRATSKTMRNLLAKLVTSSEKVFLEEAIRCFEAEAYRGAIVLGWILTIDHLYEYIMVHALSSFNFELAKVTDKRVKISTVKAKDDFGDIPEFKFIEICRSANIISGDIRKILDVKLGIRNSCAHPSGVGVSKLKASEFLDDLVTNVISKYVV